MNVYDQTHKLAEAIKESEEFKQYDSVKKQVEGNPSLEAALKDFMKKQLEIQASQIMGNGLSQEDMAQLQNLSSVLMQDPLAGQYLQCQMRFSTMMADVYKILGEVSDFGMGNLSEMANAVRG